MVFWEFQDGVARNVYILKKKSRIVTCLGRVGCYTINFVYAIQRISPTSTIRMSHLGIWSLPNASFSIMPIIYALLAAECKGLLSQVCSQSFSLCLKLFWIGADQVAHCEPETPTKLIESIWVFSSKFVRREKVNQICKWSVPLKIIECSFFFYLRSYTLWVWWHARS